MKELSDCTVLVVDDTEANVDILVDALGELYDVSVAMDGREAVETVEAEAPDLILLDIMMPEMDGYEVCETLKADHRYTKIPIIFLTALTEIENKTRGFQMGAVDYITKPFEITEVQARVKTHLSLVLAGRELEMQNEILEIKVAERTKELAVTQDVTIHSLAVLAETRDNETGGHILRTQRYVQVLARRLAFNPKFSDVLNEKTVDLFFKSAPLHDIGKVGVPDAILLKPGKLTDEEFTTMKTHCELGYQALLKAEKLFEMESKPSFLSHARDIAYTHQEKWNGSGYPQGLRGEEIPLSGRIMAVADVYDALICKRVYKPPFTHEKAVSIISEGSGSHFDPDVVDAFLEIEESVKRIAAELADDE
ncbi:MAG: two-component system response regulator [Deltaproteobacteria bacterium]|jgi:putative two-component system response regulator|nr:two-component system response regulator [Deltaproteobacteria bacterium]